MSECVVCHQTLPEPEIALIFEDEKAMSYVADLLVKISGDIAEAYHKNKLEAELSVSERELRFIVDSLAKAAGLEVSDPKDKEPGPVEPFALPDTPYKLSSYAEEAMELLRQTVRFANGLLEKVEQDHTPCTPIPRDQWPR